MRAILKREFKNYLKRPLLWLGIVVVIWGIFQNVSPYLTTHYLAEGEEITNDLPDMASDGDVYDGYVPVKDSERREYWKNKMQQSLVKDFKMQEDEANSLMDEMEQMDIKTACEYLAKEYGYNGAIYAYKEASYHKGTREEINSYLREKMEDKTFSYYFSRKFADFAGLYMGFFATIMLSLLFMQDTRKHTYELLHTKPVSAEKYVAGKVTAGFSVCLFVLAVLNVIFWLLCLVYTKNSGFEVRLFDFLAATCMYILPNMLMIVCIYGLISLLFKNPLPAVPLLLLYIVYSNMGSENAEGIYGYFGRPLAAMVRFPGQFFDTAPPPMVLLNQGFLILASAVIIFISIQLWKRRRM